MIDLRFLTEEGIVKMEDISNNSKSLIKINRCHNGKNK